MSKSVLRLRSTDTNVKEKLEHILALNTLIFGEESRTSTKYGNTEVWLENLSRGCIYYTEDAGLPCSFLFIFRKTLEQPIQLVADSRNAVHEAYHIWLSGTLPQERGKGLMSRLLHEVLNDVQADPKLPSLIVSHAELLTRAALSSFIVCPVDTSSVPCNDFMVKERVLYSDSKRCTWWKILVRQEGYPTEATVE